MAVLKHTIKCPIDGYEALELTFDLDMRFTQVNIKRANGDLAAPLIDFPNWDAVAPVLGLYTVDPATGELTDQVLPKPVFPLSVDALNSAVGMAVTQYLISDQSWQDALDDYRESRHPNLKRR